MQAGRDSVCAPTYTTNMRLVADVKLNPTEKQWTALLETLERANDAANWLSRLAWKKKTFRQYDLHHLAYYELKERFDLTSQAVIRAIAKVADAYKLDRKRKRIFSSRGAIAYDARILRFKESEVSIWTTAGRQHIPFVCGKRQRQMLSTQAGESDLIYRGGSFYLLASCEIKEPTPYRPLATLGVDLGIVNIATASDGTTHSGRSIDTIRTRYEVLKAALQRKGTKSAKRHLKKLSGRERRFRRDVNHRIAKEVVAKAKRHRASVALEELKGIRARTTVRKSQRRRHASWAFSQLRQFVGYKAALAGVPVEVVEAKGTSRTCFVCGYEEASNRKSRDSFVCKSCGYAAPADLNAACVIAARADVKRPIVATGVDFHIRSHRLATSPRL